MNNSIELIKINDQLNTLSDKKIRDLTFLLLGWMQNVKSDSEEYVKAMTNLLDSEYFKEDN